MTDLRFAIHPAIGIARIGNSDQFFWAPEVPDCIPNPAEAFKDSSGAIKRQAVRFRVFVYRGDRPPEEVTNGERLAISWRVHVANRKAAWYQFNGALDLGSALSKPTPRRNANLTCTAQRRLLVIDAGLCVISGAKRSIPLVGKFVDRGVSLGELRTDEEGRLIVLGGQGVSESLDGTDPKDDANNDGWFDDTCDGTIRASVSYRGETYEAAPAFVAIGPPNYCQGISPVVSLYDVVSNLFLDVPRPVLYWRDIYPIFERLVRCQWVNEGIYLLLGIHSPSDLTQPSWHEALSNPKRYRADRQKIFRWFRSPHDVARNGSALPPFYGDGYEFPQSNLYDLSLTPRQYECLRLWAEGEFETGSRDESSKAAREILPKLLDRAALQDCIGGPFHPGIEMPWVMRRRSMWASPFRLKLLDEQEAVRDDLGDYLTPEDCLKAHGPLDGSGPGTITRWMAVPWQTDAVSCHAGYIQTSYLPLPSFWAARVPNFVISQQAYDRLGEPHLSPAQKFKHFSRRQVWFRDIAGSSYNDRLKNAIHSWDQLGIVAPRKRPRGCEHLPDPLWIETQRRADALRDPTLEQLRIAEEPVRDGEQ